MSQDNLNYSIHPFIEEITLRACLALEVSNPALAQAVRPTMTTLSHYRWRLFIINILEIITYFSLNNIFSSKYRVQRIAKTPHN